LTKIGLTGGVESIYVYSDFRGKLITSNNGVFRVQDISNYKWIQEAQSMHGDNALKWIGHCRYLNEQQWDAYMISLICKAHTINREIKNDVFFGLNFNESLIYDVFKDIGITPHSRVYLTDGSGIILSAGNKENIGVNLTGLLGTDVFGGTDGELAGITVNRERFVRFVAQNDATNWNIVLLVPEWELFEERRIYWLIITLCLSMVITGIVFIAYRTIVRYVDTPVMKLVKFMKKAEKGDFNIRITDSRRDEFGLLYAGFNEMVSKIDILVRELYQEKLLKRDVELKYLQKLINPHFLYNTLDTLNWLARENRLSDVSALTLALSNQYRTIFNRGQEYIPLGVCLQNISDYLFIHKVRYGGAFSYRIQMGEAISDILVLNLTLQPAVENALMHGIQSRDRAGGKVVISARLRNNLLYVCIFDNGAGMWKEKLKILRMNMKSDRKSNDSGLKIVHQRIKLFYGNQYGLQLRSSFRKGTCVRFVFPAWEYLDPKRGLELAQSDGFGVFNDDRQKVSLL
jgi:two-component system sensor histidine kinase YesM